MSEYLVQDASLKAVVNAIRKKTGSAESLIFPDGFVSAISAIQTEGSSESSTPNVKWNDVTFIDYDGTVLYSYSLEEVQALTELPALPIHNGLLHQGWNWSLESIKALNRPVTVGAMYITDDGATRLNIRIADIGRMDVPLYIGQTMENGVTIDWGDGSNIQTLIGIGNVNTTHTYAKPGDYTISLMPSEGCTLSFGTNNVYYCVLGSYSNTNSPYLNMLQSAFIGKNVTSININSFGYCMSLTSITIPSSVSTIGNGAFQKCYSLMSITIPDGVTYIGTGSFEQCSSLVSVTIPDSVTSTGDNTFSHCYSLARITIPDSMISIGTNYGSMFFALCYSLTSITIPDSLISIKNNMFYGCYGMRYYDFRACTDVPTLSNTNAFSGIPSDCQMLIPTALFDEWSTATNWSTYASYMVAV